MQVLVLGPLELRLDGQVLPLRRGRPRRLFLALLLRRGDVVPAEALVERLWDDDPPQNAANALQILVSYLRKVLAATGGRIAIETAGSGYRLCLRDVLVDVDELERAVAQAPGLPAADRLSVLDGALARWRGSPYAELAFDEFALGDIARAEELHLAATEAQVDALLEVGHHGPALGRLRQLVLEHPLRERFHAQLVVALYRSGRQADALRAYDTARDVLLDELGLDPGPELRSLQQAVLAQDPALDHRRADPVAPPSPVTPGTPAAPEPTRAPTIPTGDTIGRADAIDRLRALRARRRLITLTGPAGTGKTRLAAEVASDAAVRWWADLSTVDDATGVLRVLGAAVGAAVPAGGDALEALVDRLAGTDGLLVLDTCEHVLGPVRRVVDRLLVDTGTTILATSRQALRLPHELAWPVPPLGLPDPQRLTADLVRAAPSVELFRQRAQAVHPGFEVDEANAADVARICLRLDGLPLAVELAAAHTSVLSPAAVLGLLDDRLDLLAAEHGPTPRHGTLHAAIGWSVDRLDPAEAEALARLSVFAGPFPLEAAVAVAAPDGQADALAAVLALAGQSLVATTADHRFRLLDTIRAFAGERLDEDARADARARHARWYAALAHEAAHHLRGPDVAGWVTELRAELPNLRAALEWAFDGGDPDVGVDLAVDLAWFWAIAGMFAEAAAWLDAASLHAEPDSTTEAAILSARGMHATSAGHLRAGVRDLERAAELFEAAGDPLGCGRALIYVGVAQWGLGRLPEAAATHDRATALFTELGWEWGQAISLVLRARTAADTGDGDVGELLDHALPLARRAGDPHVLAIGLDQRARLALADGDAELALALATESQARHEQVGYAEGTIASMHGVGLSLSALGRVEEAEAVHREGLRRALDLDHPGCIAEGLECLGLAAAARDAHHDAVRILLAADAYRAERALSRSPARDAGIQAALQRCTAALDEREVRHARTEGLLLDPRALVPG